MGFAHRAGLENLELHLLMHAKSMARDPEFGGAAIVRKVE
jgi:hypothetical protein